VELFRQLLPEVLQGIQEDLGEQYRLGRYEQATQLFDRLTTSEEFVEFLTLPAYDLID
jgi:malate synthase